MSPRVLLVDDNDDSREMLARILSMHGLEIAQARDGIEALEQAQSQPAVIVTDIFMPRLDGIDFTQRLRESPDLRHIPVIAQTAYIGVVDTHRDLFAAVLEKPCQPSELLAVMSSLGIEP
jgi:CheY-like chemotaxis protein